jgi:hypothetical protein
MRQSLRAWLPQQRFHIQNVALLVFSLSEKQTTPSKTFSAHRASRLLHVFGYFFAQEEVRSFFNYRSF